MKNLLQFIWKHHIFFLFLILEAGAFYLIIRNRNFHNTTVVNSANKITGNIYSSYDQVTQYFRLKKANELLSYQVAWLLNRMPEAYRQVTDTSFNRTDTTYGRQYVFTTARVINNSVHKQNNYLTLDKGADMGIREGMGVIAPDGVVGIVRNVSPNFSTVLSALNQHSQISVRIKGSDYLGSVIWTGGNPAVATLIDIPKHAVIAEGDTVVTSGSSTVFPGGVMVGRVEKVWLEEGDNFFTISIILSTDFARLSYVTIVDNLMKAEQDSLEATNPQPEP